MAAEPDIVADGAPWHSAGDWPRQRRKAGERYRPAQKEARPDLGGEARRLSAMTADGPSASAQRKHVISEVSGLRHAGEIKAYIDLLFLALVVLLCVSKIVTD